MRSLRTIAVAWIALAGACNGSSSSRPSDPGAGRDTAPPRPQRDAAPANPPIDGATTMANVFTVKSADDLDLPLATALAAAENAGADTFTVRIVPGRYRGDLQVEPADAPSNLSITVEPDGDGVVVIDGGRVEVTGRDVTIRGLLIDGAKVSNSALLLRASGTATIERVAIVGAKVGARDLQAPVVQLLAPSGKGQATLRDVWIVASTTVSAPVIATPVNGKSRFDAVTLTNVVLAGNTASTGIDPQMARALTIDGALVVEPFLADAWITQKWPQTAIQISDAVIAVRKGLVEQVTGEDVKAGDFAKVKVARSELRGPDKQEPLDATDVTWGAAPGAAADLGWAADAARQGQPPDRKALRGQLD